MALLLVTCPLLAAGGQFRVVRVHDVPRELEHAWDVRWFGSESVAIAACTAGTFELHLKPQEVRTRVLIPGGGVPGAATSGQVAQAGVWLSHGVAVSDALVIAGAPAFQLRWQERNGRAAGDLAFDIIGDADVSGERVLVLGWRRAAGGQPSPDGAIAWLVRPLESSTLTPVLFSQHGPGAKALVACSHANLSRVRFLPDGSFLIVPGVEPGVLLYGPDARLKRTWQTEDLGIDALVSIPEEACDRAVRDAAARRALANARSVVDEILPLREGAALVIRSVRDGKVSWVAKLLSESGGARTVALPLAVDGPNWRLAADVRGNRVIVLLHDAPVKDPTVWAPPRLLELEWVP